ncbi:MAG: flagellar biosynthetic protein FliR [Acidobacteriota bacterium]
MLAALQHILASLGFHTDVATFIMLLGLIFARLGLAIGLTPFLGGRAVTARIRIGLALVISLLLYTAVTPQVTGEMSTLKVMCLLVKEGVIGATLGFLSQVVFNAIQMAGAMIDYGRGMSQATFFAPQLETNVSLLGQLQFQAALVLFLFLNGHLLFLRALASSFQVVPLLDFPKFAAGTVVGVEQMARYTADSLMIAVQLSAPALLTLFLVDISFGMLGRAAPGLHAHSESQPVKSLLGMAVVLLGLAYIVGRLPGYFAGMLGEVSQLVRHIR